MCRWFAYLSPSEECLLEDVLITPAHGLTKQVHDHYLPKLVSHIPGEETTKAEIALRNKLNNIDGFGLVWYSPARSNFIASSIGTRPCMFKNARPPSHDPSFQSICANTSTTALFAHIRAATATPVVSTNNHPFVFGRHTIMHNGVISDFGAIKRRLLTLIDTDAYENIQGSTDSEHLAALYMTFLTKNTGRHLWDIVYTPEEMMEAMVQAFTTIITLQQEVLGVEKTTANSLNVCCTDGRQMVALRFRNHKVEQPPSLYWSTRAGVTLNRKYPGHPNKGEDNSQAYKKSQEHGIHVIIASEPSTYNTADWSWVMKNSAVLVRANGMCHVEDIVIPQALNAPRSTLQHA